MTNTSHPTTTASQRKSGNVTWTGHFIGSAVNSDLDAPAPALSRDFQVYNGLVHALLHVSALGAYDFTVNDVRSSDCVLAPGWTAYDHRLRFHSDDVTDLLHVGRQTVRAVLGNGWYHGNLTWKQHRDLYGDRLALLAQLELQYADGTVERVVTDESWTAQSTGILTDDLYNGARRGRRVNEGGPVPVVAVDYPLTQRTGCPSWLFPITKGATTIWERRNSMLPDSTIRSGRDEPAQPLCARLRPQLAAPRVTGLTPRRTRMARGAYRGVAVSRNTSGHRKFHEPALSAPDLTR